MVECFLRDFQLQGGELEDISVYFSIDPPLDADDTSILLERRYTSRLRLVKYIDYDARVAIRNYMARFNAAALPNVGRLVVETGYASARNAALIAAAMDENDFAINIDDDVFPCMPRDSGGGHLEWSASNFIRTHISHLMNGAEVTRGAYLGYSSPILDVTKKIPIDCQVALGRALSLGSDILEPECISSPPKVRVLPRSGKYRVSMDRVRPRTGVVIYGGNLGISIRTLKQGRLPVFFCPVGARGEDTFFGLLLSRDIRVDTVDSFVFHDPFFLYPKLLDHRFPDNLALHVPTNDNTLARFASAFRGWIAYAPLWISWLASDHQKATAIINEIRSTYLEHSLCLESLGLVDAIETFDHAAKNVEVDLEQLRYLNTLWRELMTQLP